MKPVEKEVDVPCFFCKETNVINPDEFDGDQFALAVVCHYCDRTYCFDLDVKYVVTSYDSGF